MKKFLSILLALAVGFTFTFGSAMSAFAATEYSLDDYNTALQAEKTAQLSYLATAKAKAVNELSYNKLGYTNTDLTAAAAEDSVDGYSKAAVEAAADEIIATATTAMNTKINEILNGTFPTATAPTASVAEVRAIGDAVTFTAADLLAAVKDGEKVLDLTQAPLTKTYVEGKLSVDLTKYNSTDKAYAADGSEGTDLTAVQYINVLIDTAKKEIAEADKKATAAEKLAAYIAAYTKFDTAFKAVPTLDDEAFNNGQTAGAIEAEINKYANAGITFADTAFEIPNGMAADAKITNWATGITGTYKAFWEADKVTATKGKFFGVDIANINAITRTEAVAVKNAIYAAINDSKTVVRTYAKNVADVTALYTSEPVFVAALDNAMNVADKYAEVVALGEKYKKAYEYGIKVYDDTNVDAAVKKAEELVYADLNGTLKEAKAYLEAAATALDVNLYAVNYELQKFNAAVDDAVKKMYSNVENKTATVKVLYGDNKTPEADYVYLKATYADSAAEAWGKIADKAVADLKLAQSYDEITSVMADAAAAFGKLMKAEDAADVAKAITAYKSSLDGYAAQVTAMLDTAKYDTTAVTKAKADGYALIEKATTVDGVKAAFEEAKKLIDGVKTKDELKAMKEAVEKKIAELPYTANLTVADKAAVKAAYDALAEYVKTPGAADKSSITGVAVLTEKMNKVNELEAKAIKEEAKALKEKLDKVDGTSDADLAAFIAMKADAEALVAKGKALTDDIEAVNKAAVVTVNTVDLGTDYAAIEHALEKVVDNHKDTFYAKEIANVESLLVQASKDGATEEQVKAALDAYNKLTDKQKYMLDANALQLAKTIEGKLNKFTDAEAKAYVQDLAIAVRTAKSGKKVKVTAKADVQKLVDNGYTVTYKFYKSTKKGSGYKNTVNKTTNTYTNTNPVKGKNYYKVKLVVKNADGTVVATTPLTQCKYGVRTIK